MTDFLPKSRIDRAPSPLKLKLLPPVTVMLGSMLAAVPIYTDYPIWPPLGLLVLLAWWVLRPGFWPVWAGFPLGLFDDIFSGQPMGSAAFLWSLSFILLEVFERYSIERDFWQGWVFAALAILIALLGGSIVSFGAEALVYANILLPQIAVSILVFPLIVRLVGRIDSWRLSA